VPDLVRPLLEGGIEGDAALERHRAVLGLAGEAARPLRGAALAPGDDLRAARERAHLAHRRHRLVVPLHEELEVQEGVDQARADVRYRHGVSPLVRDRWAGYWLSPATCWIWMMTNSAGSTGATPTRTTAMPRARSAGVVVVSSQRTK